MTDPNRHHAQRPPGPPSHPPDAHSKRFLLATIAAPRAIAERARPPVNLAIVLDRSGSMSGRQARRRQARRSRRPSAGSQADDRFSVVVYDDVVDVVIASTPATPGEARAGRHRAPARRSTPAAARTSARAGCAAASRSPGTSRESGVNRCLLLTDGLANVGITDAGRAGRARGRAPRAGRLDVDVRRRQRLRRAAAPGARRRRRRPLLLHRRRAADPRRHHLRGGRDARGRRPRRRARGHRPRRHPDRGQSARTRPGRRAIGRPSPSATSCPSRPSRSSCGCRSRTATLGRETGAIVALTDRDGVFAAARAAAEPVRLTWTYADDAPTTRSRATARSTGRSPGCSPPGPARRPSRRNRGGDFAGARRVLAATARRIRGYAGDDAETARAGVDALDERSSRRLRGPDGRAAAASRPTTRAPTSCAAATRRGTRSSEA